MRELLLLPGAWVSALSGFPGIITTFELCWAKLCLPWQLSLGCPCWWPAGVCVPLSPLLAPCLCESVLLWGIYRVGETTRPLPSPVRVWSTYTAQWLKLWYPQDLHPLRVPQRHLLTMGPWLCRACHLQRVGSWGPVVWGQKAPGSLDASGARQAWVQGVIPSAWKQS